MDQQVRNSLCVLLLSAFLIDCKGDRGPVGPVLSGNLAGYVSLIDNTHKLLVDKSGVIVKADNFGDSAMTLSDGSWQLKNIPAGIYSIHFSKPGYFNYTIYNLQFVGGGTFSVPTTLSMEEIPNFRVTYLNATPIDSTHQIHFQGTLSRTDSLDRMVSVLVMSTALQDSSMFQFVDHFDVSVSAGSMNFDAYSYQYSRSQVGLVRFATAIPSFYRGTYWQRNPLTMTFEFDTQGVSISNVVSFTIQ
jgi:hypothetical protein